MNEELNGNMEQKDPAENVLGPIELVETRNVIWRKGYYICRITKAYDRVYDGVRTQKVYFKVDKGKYHGFDLDTVFRADFKSRVRFSHLCKAAGFKREIKSVDLLVGKIVKVLVEPTPKNNMGRKYTHYILRLFHPVFKDNSNK